MLEFARRHGCFVYTFVLILNRLVTKVFENVVNFVQVEIATAYLELSRREHAYIQWLPTIY